MPHCWYTCPLIGQRPGPGSRVMIKYDCMQFQVEHFIHSTYHYVESACTYLGIRGSIVLVGLWD